MPSHSRPVAAGADDATSEEPAPGSELCAGRREASGGQRRDAVPALSRPAVVGRRPAQAARSGRSPLLPPPRTPSTPGGGRSALPRPGWPSVHGLLHPLSLLRPTDLVTPAHLRGLSRHTIPAREPSLTPGWATQHGALPLAPPGVAGLLCPPRGPAACLPCPSRTLGDRSELTVRSRSGSV